MAIDNFTAGRKEKRWLIIKKLSVTVNGQTIEPDPVNFPLSIKTDTNVYTPVAGDAWLIVDEIASFELAKKKVIDTAKDIGLSKVRLCRTVDLYTVLYPIT